jgi:hypothetical protein
VFTENPLDTCDMINIDSYSKEIFKTEFKYEKLKNMSGDVLNVIPLNMLGSSKLALEDFNYII